MAFYALLLLGALGLFLGHANPFLHIPLVVLCYPFVLCVLAMRAKRPFFHGMWMGTLGASAALYWVALPVHNFGGLPWVLAVPCVIVLGMYIGLWGGAFASLLTRLKVLPPWLLCAAAGLLWYTLEWVRGWLFTGFPWLSLSSAFAPWPEFIQGASALGMYGLSGLYATIACFFALAMTTRTKKPFWVGLICLALLYAAGYDRVLGTASFPQVIPTAEKERQTVLPSALTPSPFKMGALGQNVGDMGDGTGHTNPQNIPQDAFSLVLIQGNIPQNIKWEPKYQLSTLQKYAELSKNAVAELGSQGIGTDLVIWPETAMPFHYQAQEVYAPALRNFVKEQNVALLFGGPGFKRQGQNVDLFNRAFFIERNGADKGYYDKEHLVPFGEYVPPFLDFKFLEGILQGIGGFKPGTEQSPFLLELPGQPSPRNALLGMLICYEAIFPELARARVAHGATVLINISNDAWYGTSSAPRQHLHLSLIRAVEQGRFMARATNTGYSVFIDPVGRTSGETALFVDTTTHAWVLAKNGHTLYFYLHPYLPVAALILLALLGIVALRRTPHH